LAERFKAVSLKLI